MSLHPDYSVHRAMERNAAAGFHYFESDTMRYFKSKAHTGFDMPDGSTLVVMSNRGEYVVDGRRHYFVVGFGVDGRHSNESGYNVTRAEGYWLTRRSAERFAREKQSIAEQVEMGCREAAV